MASTMVTRSGRKLPKRAGNTGHLQQLPQTAGNGAPDTKTERGKRRARQKDRVQFFFFFSFSANCFYASSRVFVFIFLKYVHWRGSPTPPRIIY
jgi:hypothetical protein